MLLSVNWEKSPQFSFWINCISPRLSKKSFVGFHMARDLSRLRRSRSAASRPQKARSARQEVEVDL